MRNGFVAALGAVAVCAALLPGNAGAQTGVRGKRAGDFVIGAGLIGVFPTSGGHVDTIGGDPDASNTATPQLDFTYFITPHIAVNLIAATSRHDVHVNGSAIGDVDLGRVWILPPTLTLQVHPLPQSRFSPYVGAGINYTVFYSEGGRRSAPVTDVKIDDAWGWAFNVGFDYEIAPNWLVNADVKKLFLRPDVSVNGGAINGKADLDPWIVGASVRYRF